MELRNTLKEIEESMKKAIEATKREFGELRSGRANPKMVEGVRVNYYGTPTLLKEIATISIPEARLIVISPWDPNSVKEIEKSILQSDLGITPIVDGKIILIDEVLTPDSSRFWPADKYEAGRDQESFDKQFVRNYLESINFNKSGPGVELPENIAKKTSDKYIEAYERLTSKKFKFAGT